MIDDGKKYNFKLKNEIHFLKKEHVATHNLFPCSPKKSHPSCKQQYVYDKSKDEGVFC
jgi:hypothetical protein